jgi:murein DD-endopeptidase MepM/ murein hydrolase activator NlpD
MRRNQAYRPGQPSRRAMARPLGDPGWTPGRRELPASRPRRPDVRRWIGPLVLIAIAAAGFVLLVGGLPSSALPGSSASPATSPSAFAATFSPGPATPAATTGVRATTSPTTPSPGPAATATPALTPSPAPPTDSPEPTSPAGAAPNEPGDLDWSADVVIDIAFPFKEDVRYRYRDNWLHERPGAPEHYNHVRLRRGEVVRAHDGIDVYARPGTPVVAPFAGEVVEPSDRWQPWQAERYGVTVAIVSQEPQSAGYVALLTHLETAFVEPGEVVRRGEVIGLNGNSGNAEDSRAHLHFELRAPFPLEWREADEVRLVDAFNPYPSLRAADPATAD